MAPNNHKRNTTIKTVSIVQTDCSCEEVSKINGTCQTNNDVEIKNQNMGTQVLTPYHKKMAITANVPDNDIYSRIVKIRDTSDEIDRPTAGYIERTISDENARNQELFDIMKYEVNRLNSFAGKWPLCYIKPKDLAQNGFFYLQSEDKVQCAFCGVIIDDWNVGDKPGKKHMMKTPKCKFLMTSDSGNVPFVKPKPIAKNVSKYIPNAKTRNTLPHKPKYPCMSDVTERLRSYIDWPLMMLSSRQLAECGLFYTGVGDAVTCYYCGGSLGNWELNDDPWVEHEKFYPDCGFLDLNRTRNKPTPSFTSANVSAKSNGISARPSIPESSIPNQVIRQACEIFDNSSLVQKVAIEHFRKTGKHFTSLHDLCDAVLQYKEQEKSKLNSINTVPPSNVPKKAFSADVTSNNAPADNTNNAKIICKICYDEEINILFEPCHHQAACEKCALKITECPLCRSVITNRIKVYWG